MTPTPRARRIAPTGEGLSATVRPVIALMIGSTICYGFVSGRLTADQFMPVAGLVLGFIFARREADKADASIAAALMRPRPFPGEGDVLAGEPIAVHRSKPVVENN